MDAPMALVPIYVPVIFKFLLLPFVCDCGSILSYFRCWTVASQSLRAVFELRLYFLGV
jgi:hypothetical protein